jgi:predicted DsbA family dithiol-disulfide isomerase
LSDEGIEEVKELKQYAIAQDIHSVPTIRISNKILSGAQPVEVFLGTLQNAVNDLKAA